MNKFYLCAVFMSLLFVACENDAYEKGEGDYSLMRAELADLHVGNDKKADYFETDESVRFTVENPFTTKLFTTADSIYRLGIYYKEVNDSRAEVYSLSPVAVLLPQDIAAGEMKTDPVRFESAWLGKNGRYLNVSIYLMVGQADGSDEVYHVLGAQNDTLMLNADGTRTLHMQLFHDQGGVPEYYSQRTYMSIPIEKIDADSVSLSINTYEGVVKKVFKR